MKHSWPADMDPQTCSLAERRTTSFTDVFSHGLTAEVTFFFPAPGQNEDSVSQTEAAGHVFTYCLMTKWPLQKNKPQPNTTRNLFSCTVYSRMSWARHQNCVKQLDWSSSPYQTENTASHYRLLGFKTKTPHCDQELNKMTGVKVCWPLLQKIKK